MTGPSRNFPWELHDYADGHGFIFDAGMDFVATAVMVTKEEEANARFIVRACNSYYDM